MKEMFPNANLSDKVVEDSLRAVGGERTVDLIVHGQLQNVAWQTVEKKAAEKKKVFFAIFFSHHCCHFFFKEEEKPVAAKGSGGRGPGAAAGGRGRGPETGRPAAMRPYSNPRPVQTGEKVEGTGGVVKTFAPVTVKTTAATYYVENGIGFSVNFTSGVCHLQTC